FVPLSQWPGLSDATFFSAQTTQKPKTYTGPKGAMATENAAISARLPYVLVTGRFMHYLKVIARDKVGSFPTLEDCERWLNAWINNYVNAQEGDGPEMRARYPLREAKVELQPFPGRANEARVQAYFHPWLRYEELQCALRLVTRIPFHTAPSG